MGVGLAPPPPPPETVWKKYIQYIYLYREKKRSDFSSTREEWVGYAEEQGKNAVRQNTRIRMRSKECTLPPFKCTSLEDLFNGLKSVPNQMTTKDPVKDKPIIMESVCTPYTSFKHGCLTVSNCIRGYLWLTITKVRCIIYYIQLMQYLPCAVCFFESSTDTCVPKLCSKPI